MAITIGIVGAGTMGSGIAESAALASFDVCLHDVSADVLASARERITKSFARAVEKKRLSETEALVATERIRITNIFEELHHSNMIIEAALEDAKVKSDIFRRLDTLLSPSAILATNTSSLSITSIAASTSRAERVVGLHFFNPPAVMKLVEVIAGKQTSQKTIEVTMELARQLGKTPVLCKDTPGFIVNRVARPFYGEALRLLGEGVASVEIIDEIVTGEGGFKMGPFELMDLIGIDVNYAVTKSVYEQYFNEPRFRPHPIQRQMVEAGTLGRKTQKGFYIYDAKGTKHT